MAREKSALRSASGIANQVLGAYIDAVLRAGGDDDDVRLIEIPAIADAAAAAVMKHSKKSKSPQKPKLAPPPDITGLTVYSIVVDGDDPRWAVVDPRQYAHCEDDVFVDQFEVLGGQWRVHYVLLPFKGDPSTLDVISDTARRKLHRPTRAIVETILDARAAECKTQPIAGLAGDESGEKVSFVCETSSGREIGRRNSLHVWYRAHVFIAVVSEQLLPPS